MALLSTVASLRAKRRGITGHRAGESVSKATPWRRNSTADTKSFNNLCFYFLLIGLRIYWFYWFLMYKHLHPSFNLLAEKSEYAACIHVVIAFVFGLIQTPPPLRVRKLLWQSHDQVWRRFESSCAADVSRDPGFTTSEVFPGRHANERTGEFSSR